MKIKYKSQAYVEGMLEMAEFLLPRVSWYEYRRRWYLKGIIWSCKAILEDTDANESK